MAALTASRNTIAQGPTRAKITVKLDANAKVFKGGVVCIDTASGYGKAGAVSTTLVPYGIATKDVDNTGGAAGALSVDVEAGLFKLDNPATDAVAQANVGQNCYLLSDHEVAKTSGTSTRSVAGKLVEMDADGSAWVYLGLF